MVNPHAVGDMVEAGQLLAVITVPAWASDQSEYLLLKKQNASKAIIDGVRQKLHLSGMPEEMLALVDSTNQIQTELKIVSPISGVITELMVYIGMNVERSMTLAEVQGTNPVWVTAYIPEKDLVLTAGRARVTLPAYPDRAFQIVDTIILPQADPVTRNLPLRFLVNNSEGLLRPGLSARVSLRAIGPEGLIIPTQSLIDMGEEQRVIVRAEDGTFVPKAVTKGQESGELTLISKGLSEGEQIVTVGLFLIDSEANLRGALERLAPQADLKPPYSN
jgi:Cu(I)/Ag(I) efflux system membrane fusion protein